MMKKIEQLKVGRDFSKLGCREENLTRIVHFGLIETEVWENQKLEIPEGRGKLIQK
jgi:hypothetical protein